MIEKLSKTKKYLLIIPEEPLMSTEKLNEFRKKIFAGSRLTFDIISINYIKNIQIYEVVK